MISRNLTYGEKTDFIYWLLKHHKFDIKVVGLLKEILGSEVLMERLAFVDDVSHERAVTVLRTSDTNSPNFIELIEETENYDIEDYISHLKKSASHAIFKSVPLFLFIDIPKRHIYEEYNNLFEEDSTVTKEELDSIIKSIYRFYEESYYEEQINKALDLFDTERLKELVSAREEIK